MVVGGHSVDTTVGLELREDLSQAPVNQAP